MMTREEFNEKRGISTKKKKSKEFLSHFESKNRFRGIRRRGGWNFAFERTRYKRRESFVLERNLSILRNMLTHLLKQKLGTQSFNCSLNNLLSTQLLLSFEYKDTLHTHIYIYIWRSYDIKHMQMLSRTKKQSFTRIFNWHNCYLWPT